MATISNEQIDINQVQPTFSFTGFLVMLLAALTGAVAAIYVLPSWLPGLTASVTGPDLKVFWYLSRASAFTAYLLLWLSMVFGVGITNKLATRWPGLPPAIELHQYTSILGLVFVVFHGLILLGDQYINYRLVQILIPFATSSYKPLIVGLGQLGIYLWAILVTSFYIRKKLGPKTWRLIHFFSFLLFLFALVHGIISGTDSGTTWAQIMYWTTGGIFAILLTYRIIFARYKARVKRKKWPQQ